jgi:hypothetical protein
MTTDLSSLKRPKYLMSEDISVALEAQGLMDAYRARPAYQQNDYIGWINRSKLPQTRAKRLAQMLEELKLGGVYMKMKHTPSIKK